MKLSSIIEPYLSSESHWYFIPHAQYFNENNIDELHKVLIYFQKYQYDNTKTIFGEPNLREWNHVNQKIVYQRLISDGIIKPTAKKIVNENDWLVNFRQYKNLIKKLGFGFVNKEKHFFLSEAGLEFINATQNEWKSVFEKQILRLQFHNPSLEKGIEKYQKFRIFPYYFTLSVLQNLTEKYVTPTEVLIFISVATNNTKKEVEKVSQRIETYRNLEKEQQVKLVRSTELNRPAITDASLICGLFGCTETLKFQDGKLQQINDERAKYLLSHYKNRIRFIEYENFEDWYNFIGTPAMSIDNKAVIEYYTSINQIDKAKQVIQEVVDDIEIKQEEESLKETLEHLILEKILEDALEKNPTQIEKGIKILNRQFSTEVGRIDLFCKDTLGRYVVVELKRDRTSDKVVGQTLRYMGWVKSNLSPNNLVRGIIIGRQLTNELRMALVGLQNDNKELMTAKEIDINITTTSISYTN